MRNVISYVGSIKADIKRLRTSGILVISNSPTCKRSTTSPHINRWSYNFKFSLLRSLDLYLVITYSPISFSLFPTDSLSLFSFSSSLVLSLTHSLQIPASARTSKTWYSHSAVIALARESMGIMAINCQKVISITLISCWNLKWSKMSKKVLNGAKLQAKLEMSPQRSYARDLRRSWE